MTLDFSFVFDLSRRRLSTRQRRYTFTLSQKRDGGGREKRERKRDALDEGCSRKADAGGEGRRLRLNRSPSLYEPTIITMAIKVYRSYRSIINRIIARSSNSAIAGPINSSLL